MLLADFMQKTVCTIQRAEKLASAARILCDHSIGALVITDSDGATPLGVITDRDIVWMVAEGLDPRVAEVSQFVQSPLRTACVTDSLSDVTRAMREHGVRRLPIVDPEGRLVGLVSLDDLVVLLGRELGDVAATIVSELEQERRIGAAARQAAHPEGRPVRREPAARSAS